MYHFLFIHSTIHGHLGHFHLLTTENNGCSEHWLQCLRKLMYLFETLLSILRGTYLGVELLDHMVTLCLTF